ncbi:MAG: MaoC family dehydratase [Jannaschia sp.]
MTPPIRLPARPARMPSVGDVFELAPRAMTRERMRWYVDAQATAVANDGKPRFGGPTIHDDHAYAVSQGLPGIIADGMVSTNWILALLTEIFGPAAASTGRLRTKYIAPVYENDLIETRVTVTSARGEGARSEYLLDVLCQRADGTAVTVGEARIGRADG